MDAESTAADAEGRGLLEQADLALGKKLAKGRRRPLVRAAGLLGKLGDQQPLYAFAGLLLGAGLLARRPRLAEAGVRIGLAVAVADLTKSALKRTVVRTRPYVALDDDRYERRLGGSAGKPEQSFPSGHMAGALAAAAALRRAYPGSIRYSLPLCGVLAWSRISKGAHWPSDVIAGAGIGLAAETATAGLLRRLARAALAAARPVASESRFRIGDLRRSGKPGGGFASIWR